MKSISLRRLAVAMTGLSAVAGIALAAGPDAGPIARGEPINVADMTRQAQERAAAVDLDKDGYITAAETKAYHEQQREARAAEKFARMDTNKDGKVSLAEFTAAHTDRIQQLDANGDGVVDRSEMRAGHGHGGHHGGHCGEAPAG